MLTLVRRLAFAQPRLQPVLLLAIPKAAVLVERGIDADDLILVRRQAESSCPPGGESRTTAGADGDTRSTPGRAYPFRGWR